ncbi:poly(glycerol-phosphate) alpha-glucosyltransferase [Marihabitans asiaticum]|uniref:Poly(Glycerol-phosphate) alpha-glucosyltransferase n=2 Tax=Marihabitans asiaticum TaxID=415218 RepID=A0A560WGY8_9MICO|nr:poly(glycerol-phosphate) alpha-glucosyltransferase [Marihabitans asiaticum]
MVTWGIADDFGGMTTVCLQRARMFSEHADVVTPVLTFEPIGGYRRTMESLRNSGHGFDQLEIWNVYHYYRSADLTPLLGADEVLEAAPEVPEECSVSEIVDDDGLLFCRVTKLPQSDTVILREYVRPDGSTYLVDQSPVDEDGRKLRRTLTMLTKDGRIAGRWAGATSLYHEWLRTLASGGPTALIIDSIFTARLLTSFEEPNIVKLAVLHNSHAVPGQDPLSGSLSPRQRPVSANTSAWDAVVFLTDGQRDDFVRAFGGSDNMYAISNARQRVSPEPAFDGRSRTNGAMACSLSERKNVEAAIRIIHRASATVPDVHLDVYGGGPEEQRLRDLIDELGAHDHVTLRGPTPQASRAFESAAFSLLTSRKEGQPLVLMESLGRGCPPVAFDIRYGPSSLITDGENGFLVQEGDHAAAAERIVQICTDEALARRLGQAAWQGSNAFAERAVLDRWLAAIAECFTRKNARLVVRDLTFDITRTTLWGSGAVEVLGDITWTQSCGPPAVELIEPYLAVRRRAVGPPTFLPVKVRERRPGRLSVVIAFAPDDCAPTSGPTGKFLDLSVGVRANNLRQEIRVSFGAGREPWLPYSTAHGSVSIQRRLRAPA